MNKNYKLTSETLDSLLSAFEFIVDAVAVFKQQQKPTKMMERSATDDVEEDKCIIIFIFCCPKESRKFVI